MPFTTIYHQKITREILDLVSTTEEKCPREWEIACRMWEILMEQYPQYEDYKDKAVPFWAGKNGHVQSGYYRDW